MAEGRQLRTARLLPSLMLGILVALSLSPSAAAAGIGSGVAAGGSAELPIAARAPSGALGQQRTAVILANAPGAGPHSYANKAQVVRLFFSAANSLSARAWFDDASYGQVRIVGGSGAEGTVADVYGPVNINTGSCSFTTIATQTLAAADTRIDYNRYDRVVISYNGPTSCTPTASYGQLPWGPFDGARQILGVALVPGRLLEHPTIPTKIGGVALHEYGHTFRLAHPGALECGAAAIRAAGCTTVFQGDPSDVMSSSQGYGQFNSVYKESLGWLAGRLRIVTTSGTYTINAYEDRAVNTKALKIPRVRHATGATDYYYLEYRKPPTRWNQFTIGGVQPGRLVVPGGPAFGNGVLLRLADNARAFDRCGAPCPLLLDTHPNHIPDQRFASDIDDAPLVRGQTFADPTSGVRISVTATTATTATTRVILPRR